MWKRIELHNHTIESDGKLTVQQLVDYLYENNIQSFSLTDHNTISGWSALETCCKPYHMEFIQGFELTSFYGHMLAHCIHDYIDWEDIDEQDADKLIKRVHAQGGICGPAHPFSIPSPFSNGMNWTMKIHDYHLVDFIEIMNNAHKMYPDNEKAIAWWESLVYQGYRIAPVSGMDLHRYVDMHDYFTTYIYVEDTNISLQEQLKQAIHTCHTQVTKNVLIDYTYDTGLHIRLKNKKENTKYIIECRTKDLKLKYVYTNSTITLPASMHTIITIFVYEDYIDMKNLCAITGPIQI